MVLALKDSFITLGMPATSVRSARKINEHYALLERALAMPPNTSTGDGDHAAIERILLLWDSIEKWCEASARGSHMVSGWSLLLLSDLIPGVVELVSRTVDHDRTVGA